LPPLREETHLDQAAQVQSDDIATRHFFAHVNPDGRTPQDRITAAAIGLVPPQAKTSCGARSARERPSERSALA
jgi:uncharacterized protein YkwD